jgi:hypothetical protein
MALTESKIKDLEDKEFDKLFKKHRADWIKMVSNAFYFTQTHITDGKEPRQDDVLKELLPMLEVNEDLRKHQEEVHARYPRFREYFGEYIIDDFYRTELAKDERPKKV